MTPAPTIELSGILSRCTFSDSQAELRLSPFAFSQRPDAQPPVFSLAFRDPAFDQKAVEAYLDIEVDVEVFATKVVLYDVWKGSELVLSAKTLTVSQVDYDTADFQSYTQRLETEVEQLQARLTTADTKITKGRATLEELLRRAEIKAATSDHLRDRQAAAIEVLKRMITHFEG